MAICHYRNLQREYERMFLSKSPRIYFVINSRPSPTVNIPLVASFLLKECQLHRPPGASRAVGPFPGYSPRLPGLFLLWNFFSLSFLRDLLSLSLATLFTFHSNLWRSYRHPQNSAFSSRSLLVHASLRSRVFPIYPSSSFCFFESLQERPLSRLTPLRCPSLPDSSLKFRYDSACHFRQKDLFLPGSFPRYPNSFQIKWCLFIPLGSRALFECLLRPAVLEA